MSKSLIGPEKGREITLDLFFMLTAFEISKKSQGINLSLAFGFYGNWFYRLERKRSVGCFLLVVKLGNRPAVPFSLPAHRGQAFIIESGGDPFKG